MGLKWMPIYPVLHQMKILFIQVKIFELDSYQCHKFHQQQFFLKYRAIQDLKIEDLLFNGWDFQFSMSIILLSNLWFFLKNCDYIYTRFKFLSSFSFYSILVTFYVYNIVSYFCVHSIFFCELSFASCCVLCPLNWVVLFIDLGLWICSKLSVIGGPLIFNIKCPLIFKGEAETSCEIPLRYTSCSHCASLCFFPPDSKFKLS